MANVKNFGLIGVGSNVQFGKAGSKIVLEGGAFQFKAANGSTDAALSSAAITASGNVAISGTSGAFSINADTTLTRLQAGVFKFDSSAAVVAPVGTTLQRPEEAAAGMYRYNTSTSVMEFYNGSIWVAIATGGQALTAVSVATANGFSGTSSGGTTPELTLKTTAQGLLTGNSTTGVISAAVSGTDIKTVGGVSLVGSGDIGVIGAAYGGTGVNNGTDTITTEGNVSFAGAFSTTGANALSIATTGATSVTMPTSGTLLSTANIAANAVTSFSAGETGFTPNTASNGVVTLAGTLNAVNGGTGLSSFSTGNVLYASATNTWAAAAPGATSGVQAYDAGLAALAAKTSTGLLVQTGDDTYTSTTIQGTAGNIVVTNGSGVSAAPTIDLAGVTQAASGNFVKVTLDSFGRVTGNTAVVTSDITTLVDATYVALAGSTMNTNANLVFSGTGKVTGLAAPTADTDATNKAYVDALTAGLSWKNAVRAATTGNITLSGTQTIDGVAVIVGNRVLVKSQTVPAENGIYVVAAGAWSRAGDMSEASEFDGAAVFVQEGTTLAGTGWTETATVTTVGTDAVTFSQFTGGALYTWGVGLTESGNTVSVNLGAGIIELPSDEVGIDVASGKAVQLTSLLTGGQLTFVLDTGSGMEQSATGLKISTGGVTNSMLANSVVTFTGTTGSDSVALGESMAIIGDADAITTAMGTNSLAISVRTATTSQKGVASFSSDDFTVTAGAVTLNAINLASADVTGVLPAANGGTGVDNTGKTITLGGSLTTVGAFTTSITSTGTTAVTLPTSGTLLSTDTIASSAVTSFQTSLTGLTPSTASNGVVTLAGTLGVASGGTGATTFTAGRVLLGNGTGAIAEDAALAFNTSTDTLTVGTATIQGGATDVTITATGTNGDINLVTNGSGTVNIGAAGAGVIQSDSGQSLTVTGSSTLALTAGTGAVTITSTAGDTVMALAAGTTAKVTVTGPTAAEYATGLEAADLANKQYVDDVAAAGGAGDVKALKAVVSLAAAGTFNIGSVVPTGSTVLSVKVNVTAADTATGTLAVGVSGTTDAYMGAVENDTQTTGLYVAECMVVNAAAQIIATVAGTPGGTGSATIVVTYQLPN